MKITTACLYCILLLAASQVSPAQGASTPQATEVAIQAYLAAWDKAWNAHDIDGILRLHAEDCVTVNRFGTLFVGKQATAKHMERLQKQIFKDAHFPPIAPVESAFTYARPREHTSVMAKPILDAAASPANKRYDRIFSFATKRVRLVGGRSGPTQRGTTTRHTNEVNSGRTVGIQERIRAMGMASGWPVTPWRRHYQPTHWMRNDGLNC